MFVAPFRGQSFLVEDDRGSEQRGHCPPKDESKFQRQLWQTKVGAKPRETPPDERRAEDAEQPACRRDHPEPEASTCGS